MDHIRLLRTTAAVFNQRSDWGEPLRLCKGLPSDHPKKRLLKRVVITMRNLTSDNDERYTAMTKIFGRPISSTYDITVGEARAFLLMAYPEDPLRIDPEFARTIIISAREIT